MKSDNVCRLSLMSLAQNDLPLVLIITVTVVPKTFRGSPGRPRQ